MKCLLRHPSQLLTIWGPAAKIREKLYQVKLFYETRDNLPDIENNAKLNPQWGE